MSDRPWPTEAQIIQGQARFELLGDRARIWSTFSFASCPHERSEVCVVGDWELEVCVECGQVTRRVCRHTEMEWNEAGTLLRCKNCGLDGT